MSRTKKKSTRLRALLAFALGAIAVLALAGLAVAKDGNDDRIPDRWEQRHNLSLKVDQSGRDQDHDSLRNRAEFRSGNDPRDRDSDDDGTLDGDEGAGTIASFDPATGRLAIDLFGGDEIAGLVTDRTKIKCEDEHSHDSSGVHPRRSHGEPEPGDDNGGHGNEAGDDHGDDGVEPGDDNGGDNSGPGSEHSGQSGHDDNGTGANCTSADLMVGAVVEEADLEIEHGKATFDEVELAH